MRSMATRWSDAEIAATLNRMGMQTGQGKTWTPRRVQSLPHGAQDQRLSLFRQEWRVAHHVGCGREARRVARQNPPFHQGWPLARRAGHARRALPDPRRDLEDERIKADLARNTPRRIHDDNQESLFSAI